MSIHFCFWFGVPNWRDGDENIYGRFTNCNGNGVLAVWNALVSATRVEWSRLNSCSLSFSLSMGRIYSSCHLSSMRSSCVVVVMEHRAGSLNTFRALRYSFQSKLCQFTTPLQFLALRIFDHNQMGKSSIRGALGCLPCSPSCVLYLASSRGREVVLSPVQTVYQVVYFLHSCAIKRSLMCERWYWISCLWTRLLLSLRRDSSLC